MGNIYSDGSYLDNIPGLHEEDSEFKFLQIRPYLDRLSYSKETIRLLDVGGGAGRLGFLVADYLHKSKGYSVEFVALDLSPQMLEIQKVNNPYITKTINTSLLDISPYKFHLTLMVDVIEHISEKELAARKLNEISEYVIYNIPSEINLIDILRNLHQKGRYYPSQRLVLGHVHFFNYLTAKKFMNKHHEIISCKFVEYCNEILQSDDQIYVKFRKGKMKSIELQLSKFICSYLCKLAPYLIQGSVYSLVRVDRGSA